MFKSTVLVAAATILALVAINGRPVSNAGAWQIDAQHSDAQLVTDATTNYGKTKIDATLGFARVTGVIRLDEGDPAKSSVDLEIYPATSTRPPISEDGKFLDQWLANRANNTLVCFHSKGVSRTPEGRLKTTGALALTRVDRNVEVVPSEAYAGPVYGPPMIHRVTHEMTFVLNPRAADVKDQKDGGILMSGSTSMFREDFPQLVQAAVSTHWPVVVQDESCKAPVAVGEDYQGPQCTGVFLEAPPLPQVPKATTGEDYPAASNFNTVVGNRLNILVHLRLTPKSAAAQAALGE
jgi:polyisoprenoid-binding protein YceI